MIPVAHVEALLAEAERTDERRVVVLSGEHVAVTEGAHTLLAHLPVALSETVAVSSSLEVHCRRIDPTRSVELMGSEARLVVMDARDGLIPNALGRCGGAVIGGGLLVLLCPPLEDWPDRRDTFDQSLVVEPFTLSEVTGWFRRWIRETFESNPGICIIDADGDTVVKSGLTGGARRARKRTIRDPPAAARFPAAAYNRCRTNDQRRTLLALEALLDPPRSIIIQADRGRGKSSVAGLAAASFAADGYAVAVTAPEATQATPLVEHALALLACLEVTTSAPRAGPIDETDVRTTTGGRLAFVEPANLVEPNGTGWDAIFADEAAGLPVPTLTTFLAAPRVVCTTTLHGYEGSGQGFATRFMTALDDARHDVTEVTMAEPIRYAADDPVERWLNRVLLLDARPAVADAIEDADPETAEFVTLDPEAFMNRPERFREAVGLLAMAHYRTEPDDIARLLDAPNLSTVGLLSGGRVVTIALLAREGNLPVDRREAAYLGERLRGNLVPDVLINEFRDVDGAGTGGIRIVRLATHPAVRRRGLASRLLADVRMERGVDLDWLAAGFGATPDLVAVWAANGFLPVFLSASRNASSGAFSVVMIQGLSPRGSRLVARHAMAFPHRLAASLADVHREVDPAVIDAIFRAVTHRTPLSLRPAQWRFVAAIAFGPGRYDLDPTPIKELLLHDLTGSASSEPTLPIEERTLLIAKVFQGRPWEEVATAFSYHSVSMCRRALRDAIAPLALAYGGRDVEVERDRLTATGEERP